jgi:hypothetical protein
MLFVADGYCGSGPSWRFSSGLVQSAGATQIQCAYAPHAIFVKPDREGNRLSFW